MLYEDRICLDCNKVYTPTGGTQKRCPPCGLAARTTRNRRLALEKYNENPQASRARAKEWRVNNKSKVKKQRDSWRNRNQKAVQKHHQTYRDRHREDYLEYIRTPKYRYQQGRSTAKRRGFRWLLSYEEYCELIAAGLCHYCGRKLNETGSGLDRRNEEKYYNKESAVPCCVRCNSTFMDNYTYEEKMMLSDTIKRIDERRS